MSSLQDRISKLGFISDIRNLKSRLETLEAWRVNQADPKMQNNKNFIQSIEDEIKDRIQPTINRAVKDIEEATITAQKTLDEAKAVFNQVKGAGEDLKEDGIVVKKQVDDLRSILESEIGKIIDAFKIFGLELQTAADMIVVKAGRIGEEMTEAKEEIQPTLDAAIVWAKRINSRRKRHNWFGAFHAAFVCVKRVLFEGVSSTSGAVIPELLEALREISIAFKELGVSFEDFGEVMKSAPEDLGGTIGGTTKAMETSVGNFTGSFGALINNLSSNLKGILAIETFTPEPVLLAPIPKTRPHPTTVRKGEVQRAKKRRALQQRAEVQEKKVLQRTGIQETEVQETEVQETEVIQRRM